jgi:hypothetical protein
MSEDEPSRGFEFRSLRQLVSLNLHKALFGAISATVSELSGTLLSQPRILGSEIDAKPRPFC